VNRRWQLRHSRRLRMALASRLGRESMTLLLVLWQYGQRMGVFYIKRRVNSYQLSAFSGQPKRFHHRDTEAAELHS